MGGKRGFYHRRENRGSSSSPSKPILKVNRKEERKKAYGRGRGGKGQRVGSLTAEIRTPRGEKKKIEGAPRRRKGKRVQRKSGKCGFSVGIGQGGLKKKKAAFEGEKRSPT